MIATALTTVVLAVLAIGAALAAWQSRRWLAGRPATVGVVAGLRALPGRYLVDVHHVVGRTPFNARFHALVAGGFLAAVLLLVAMGVAIAVSWSGSRILWLLLALVLVAMLAGALMVRHRRRVLRPRELSQGRFARLPLSLLGFSACLLVVALDQSLGGVMPEALALVLIAIAGVAMADLVWGCGRDR